jgi:uncharacterized membrane protein YcaP (DUF421 family)
MRSGQASSVNGATEGDYGMSLDALIGTDQLITVAVKAPLAFWYVVILLRVAGKRATMTMTTFDFVSTVAMATIIGSTIVSPSVSLIEGLAAITALVAVQWAVGSASSRSERFRNLVTGSRKVLYEDGHFIDENLRSERLSREELLQKVRAAGHADTETVGVIILEHAGTVSVIPKQRIG